MQLAVLFAIHQPLPRAGAPIVEEGCVEQTAVGALEYERDTVAVSLAVTDCLRRESAASRYIEPEALIFAAGSSHPIYTIASYAGFPFRSFSRETS